MGSSSAKTSSFIFFLVLFLLLFQCHSQPLISSPSQTNKSQNVSLQMSVSTNLPAAYGSAQSPHDLTQLDCYLHRLVLRSIARNFTDCHAGHSQARSADGAFLEFYGRTHGSLPSSDPTLSGAPGKAMQGSTLHSVLSPPHMPTKHFLP